MFLFITYFVSLNVLWCIVAMFTLSKKDVELIVNKKKNVGYIFLLCVCRKVCTVKTNELLKRTLCLLTCKLV